MANAKISRIVDEDGWKAVVDDDKQVLGCIKKLGESWRARWTNPTDGVVREYLGFGTQRKAADKIGELVG